MPNNHLVCKAKCGKHNECPGSTSCDFISDVCVADEIGISLEIKKYFVPCYSYFTEWFFVRYIKNM